jgi:D-threonine aldolase
MDISCYDLEDRGDIFTPALIVFRELVVQNLETMLRIAGGPARLRPHCKTHKIAEVIALELARGIVKHKCATLAEAEMLARVGVRDIFLAYNLVGPNIARAVRLLQAYQDLQLAVTVDHPQPLATLGAAMRQQGLSVQVLLDLDTGMHRTGLPVGTAAERLYEQIAATPGVVPGGLHVYDGQNHQAAASERRAAVLAAWERVVAFRDARLAAGLPVPRIVAGGTGTFPSYAAIDDPTLELSPGTCVFHDAGYTAAYPDLHFQIAAVLLTRVISRPGPDRVTLDLGYKACASDPPAGRRLVFPELPEAEQVLQNEEHLVLQTPRAARFQPGDELIAIPWHICPTTALHKRVYVAEGGRIIGRWDVAARDRQLTI